MAGSAGDKLIRIAVVGPESTGKSDLSQALADHFDTVWIPEYAREYLENLGRSYREADLLAIARGQLALEAKKAQQARRLLIADTNLLVIKVWSQVKYGRVAPEILDLWQPDTYDLHLLLRPDLPWQDDPLREHPQRREELYAIYHRELTVAQIPFAEIDGRGERRNQNALLAIRNHLGISK